jgi:hypothetical protein
MRNFINFLFFYLFQLICLLMGLMGYVTCMGVESLVLSMVNTGKVRTVTFPITCITIQLLQFEPSNAHNFINVTILQHTNSYMFWTS